MGGILKVSSLTQGRSKGSQTIASHENVPHKKDWETWFNLWHSYVLMGDKLEVPLGD
jgi:hypothetical protein